MASLSPPRRLLPLSSPKAPPSLLPEVASLSPPLEGASLSPLKELNCFQNFQKSKFYKLKTLSLNLLAFAKPLSEDINGVESDVVTVRLVFKEDGAVGVVQQLDFEEARP